MRYSWILIIGWSLASAGPNAVLADSPRFPRPTIPDQLDTTMLRGMIVQHDGRWMPLDTAARDVVETITGKAQYQGQDAIITLLAWTFHPDEWKSEPLITIGNAALRRELDLATDRTMFSEDELHQSPRIQEVLLSININSGCKLGPLEEKVRDIDNRLALLEQAFQGQVIMAIPNADGDESAPWVPITAVQSASRSDLNAVAQQWNVLKQAFEAGNATRFTTAARELVGVLNALPADHRPDPSKIALELRYNWMRPFRVAWIIMAIGTALTTMTAGVHKPWVRRLSLLAVLAGFTVLCYGLWMRWTIAERIPASNMYESLLFLSWGTGAFAMISMLAVKDRLIPLTASFVGALALFLADVLPLDHYIRPVVPVLLDTIWMSIHVPVIMVSYSVLALAALIAHVQLVLCAAAPTNRQWIGTLHILHFWYIHVGCLLLAVGIITGSMWAASSWGRYWGWDPKEVWSLIAFLAYLAILHVRVNHERITAGLYILAAGLTFALLLIIVPALAPPTPMKLLTLTAAMAALPLVVLTRGPFATAFKSVLAFWLIIMTYVGVNYVLGMGLHSYGFGTGAVAHNLLRIGGIDLAVITLCLFVYLARGGTLSRENH